MWSSQQESAIKEVKSWLNAPRKTAPQVFRLFGYAGTGKTTLARHLADEVKGSVLYACFTGKAALVLQKKGCEGASTIHSLIYKSVEDPATGDFSFILNGDSPLSHAGLLIVDEVSMVGEDLARDLLSFGTRILVLGDPAQLPPVKGEGYFINGDPDVMLTDVHRQAADNPIIRMSMEVREGRQLQIGTYGDSRVIRRGDITKDAMRDIVLASDQLLCGMNKTRNAFNGRVRAIKGMTGGSKPWHPVVGDRLICLRNNREKGLLNGSMWEATRAEYAGENLFMLRAASLDSPEKSPVDIMVRKEFFSGTENLLDWKDRRKFDEFTFGEAITVHKSQGSQWDNVLLFDESRVFRENAAKHLYTGITRAAERVTVVV